MANDDSMKFVAYSRGEGKSLVPQPPEKGLFQSTAEAPSGAVVVLDNSTDLSKVITGSGDAVVREISMVKAVGGIYAYQINVMGKGPRGLFAGGMELKFHDASGDSYKLELWSSSMASHEVQFNSSDAHIVKIEWYNTST
ncbi:hypothetical protein ACIQUL_29340 [Streptomyces sp. NPDC090303]|uniref:hypothetical protein n=1 Tax=Streptomyces sp. NPDC090303 TaxID=3365960 RepID=UPI00381A5721